MDFAAAMLLTQQVFQLEYLFLFFDFLNFAREFIFLSIQYLIGAILSKNYCQKQGRGEGREGEGGLGKKIKMGRNQYKGCL